MQVSSRRGVAFGAVLLLSLLAMVNGAYLSLVHIDYLMGRDGLQAACQAFGDAGCSVTAGRFGAVFGVPVSIMGAAGAAVTFLFGAVALFRRHHDSDPARDFVLLLSGFSVLVSVLMAVFSVAEQSFCPFCVIWYGLNIAMLVAAWWGRDRGVFGFGSLLRGFRTHFLRASLVFLSIAMLGLWLYRKRIDHLLEVRTQELLAAVPELVQEIMASPPVEVALLDTPRHSNDRTEGARAVEIVEFGDFQCPHCKTLFQGVEAYLTSSPRPVQVSFAHYPLDSHCNPGAGALHPFACGAAKAAVCAQAQGRFWPFAELLFANQSDLSAEALHRHAQAAGLELAEFGSCIDSDATLVRVQQDIQRGDRLGVRQTPTFFVNGYRIEGSLPGEVLASVIDAIAEAP